MGDIRIANSSSALAGGVRRLSEGWARRVGSGVCVRVSLKCHSTVQLDDASCVGRICVVSLGAPASPVSPRDAVYRAVAACLELPRLRPKGRTSATSCACDTAIRKRMPLNRMPIVVIRATERDLEYWFGGLLTHLVGEAYGIDARARRGKHVRVASTTIVLSMPTARPARRSEFHRLQGTQGRDL